MAEDDAVAGVEREAVLRSGAWVWNDTGRLLRVHGSPREDLHSPVIEYLAPPGASRMTLLSTDSRLPVEDLRALAAAASIRAAF